MKKKMITDPMGQWKHPGKNTRIPSDKITMKGVNYPVLGVSNNGHEKMMYPGQEYIFPGADYVDEFPQLKKGGRTRGLIPMPKPSKKGLASKKYSRSLEATNRLFTENKLFEKPKSRKNKVFDPKAKYYQKGGNSDFNIKPSLYTNSNIPSSQIIGANIDMSHKSGLHGNINAEVPFMNRNTTPSLTQNIGIGKKYRNVYGDVTLSNYSEPGNLFNPSANLELGYKKNLGKNFVANAGIQNTMTPGSYFNPRITTGIKYGFQDGGENKTKLSKEEEKQFQKFYKTLPENLQSDDNTYDIRGYWDALGRPQEFDYTQPKESDGYYHAFSINPNTGEYLKSPAHDTFQHAVDEDRKIGYRPLTNVYGRNIAVENESISDPEEQSFLTDFSGPTNYIDLELNDNEIDQYVKGGYVVEDISIPSLTKAQQGLGEIPAKQELMQASKASIKTDPNLNREAVIGEKIANYTPTEASYKGMDRPKSNFVPSEDASPEFINKLKSSGYYPVKSESGDYEVFSNKDISDLIYQKGMSPGELSEKLKLGDTKEIEKQFKPVYDSAAGIHAKRNKEKIDSLIKSGMSKDQAISSLVKQGEGDVKGLTSMYGDYTEDAYQKQKAEADKLIGNNKQPGLKEEYENFFAKQDKKRADELQFMQDKIDYSGSLTPSETNINTANKSLGNFGRMGKDAYGANESLKAGVSNVYKGLAEQDKSREVVRAVLNSSNLTDEQRKEYLNDPVAFQELYDRYQEYEKSPDKIEGTYNNGISGDIPYYSAKSNFDIKPIGKGTFKLPAGLGINSFGTNQYGVPGYNEQNINANTLSTSWQAAKPMTNRTNRTNTSGRINMLDEEYIKGLAGGLSLGPTSSIVSSGLKYAPASMPWLSAGNAMTAKGIYDTATEYVPNAYNAVKEANTNKEGWTNELIGKAAYNTTKSLLSGVLPLSSKLQSIGGLKKAKTIFTAADNGIPAAAGSKDPLKHIKFLNSVEGISKMFKKSGGSANSYIESELSQKEINDLIAQGYTVEEVD